MSLGPNLSKWYVQEGWVGSRVVSTQEDNEGINKVFLFMSDIASCPTYCKQKETNQDTTKCTILKD